MTDHHVDLRSGDVPFRTVMRTTAAICVAAALAIVGVDATGLMAGTEELVPLAFALVAWAGLLGVGSLFARKA